MSNLYPSVYPQFSGDILSRTNLFVWYREFLRNSGIPPGYYIEFGVQNGESIIDVYRQLRGHFTHVFGFDSFKGIPPAKNPIDLEGVGQYPTASIAGNYNSLSPDEVRKNIISSCRMPSEMLTLVDGFFEDTIPKFDKTKLLKYGELCGVYIDCTSYDATKMALDFTNDLIKDGTWLFFDDYWCYRGSPKYGPQKAISDWLNQNPKIGISEYSNFRGFGKSFICYLK